MSFLILELAPQGVLLTDREHQSSCKITFQNSQGDHFAVCADVICMFLCRGTVTPQDICRRATLLLRWRRAESASSFGLKKEHETHTYCVSFMCDGLLLSDFLIIISFDSCVRTEQTLHYRANVTSSEQIKKGGALAWFVRAQVQYVDPPKRTRSGTHTVFTGLFREVLGFTSRTEYLALSLSATNNCWR